MAKQKDYEMEVNGEEGYYCIAGSGAEDKAFVAQGWLRLVMSSHDNRKTWSQLGPRFFPVISLSLLSPIALLFIQAVRVEAYLPLLALLSPDFGATPSTGSSLSNPHWLALLGNYLFLKSVRLACSTA